MQFDNILGFYAFASLLALILIYLIRPRPKEVEVPSIMFLMKESGTTKESSFFRRFYQSIVFIFQFAALGLLAFAITSPLISVSYDSTAENTVIVLDVSASMQTDSGMGTRFDEAVGIAKKNVKGQTSIVLAENVPIVALDSSNEAKAIEFLSGLKPKETRSNIGDGIMLAGELLSGKEGRIVVISDFIFTEGADPEVAKTLLEAEGIVVDFVDVGNKADNIGIVNIKIDNQETKVYVKNYNDKEETVGIEITNKNKTTRNAKNILPNSIETFVFPTTRDITYLKLPKKDDFTTDNLAYISNPQKEKIKVLLITNQPNIYLKNALLASDNIDLSVAEPPVVPPPNDYEIIIFGRFDDSKLLKGTKSDIVDAVQKGKGVIITYQNDLSKIDFRGMLPVTLDGKGDETHVVAKVDNQLTKDVDFGKVSNYIKATTDNNSIIIAAAHDNSPMVVLKEMGDGKVVYYGINDQKSEFKNSPPYPIFWNTLIRFLLGVENINNFNHDTGKIIAFENEKNIETPLGSIKTSKLILDKAGFYKIEGKTHAANIASEQESDVSQKKEIETTESENYNAEPVIREKDVNLEMFLLIAAFIIILAELIYIKFRGDL